MREFPKPLANIMAILAAFTLGGYVTQEYMFNQPVEVSRYVLTFVFGFIFYLYANKES